MLTRKDVVHRVVGVEGHAVQRMALASTGLPGPLISMPSGLLEPTSCSASKCATTRPSSTSGTAITWKLKKRFRVASPTT